ncbi:hypothetical protein ACIGO9_19620 [Nocardia asteroides]|uniref:hypothetical protein n=1 Tax=Nocardia asteroides TaxID=1824 RepID=UPI0037C9B21C
MTDDRRHPPAPDTESLDAALDRIRRWTQAALGRDTLIPSTAAEPPAEDQLPVLAQLASLFTRTETALPTLLPCHDLLTATRSDQVRAMWLDIGADQRARFPEFAATHNPEVESRQPAGSASELFLPEFTPIADRDGSTLFVDVRAGEHQGCVSEYSASGASTGLCWPSPAAMFTALADSLTTAAAFLRHRPEVHSEGLHWLPA